MTRIINYHSVITYNLDEVIASIVENDPDLSPEDAEQEARKLIEEWAHEDFGTLGFTTVEEDVEE